VQTLYCDKGKRHILSSSRSKLYETSAHIASYACRLRHVSLILVGGAFDVCPMTYLAACTST